MNTSTLYRRFWRWHFYAGLFVIPFVLILACSGAIFLFKPQVERWEERPFQQLPLNSTETASAQVDAALASFPGARLHSYRLPERAGDAALVHLALPDHHSMRDVFVSPQGIVLGDLDPESRIIAVVRRIHGQLLLGPRGSWLVELAASWTIVMLVTGLYLWWPRGRGLAGVVWPRRRALLRDLHAVTGFWIAGFALVLLLSGLPWADVWGSAFKSVRHQMGWVQGTQDWSIGGRTASTEEHSGHDHDGMHAGHAAATATAELDRIVAAAAAEELAFPVLVVPPAQSELQGNTSRPEWTVKSDTQNRPQRVTIRFDAGSGAELSRSSFEDQHPIDRVVGYGVAWHEGQLFGAVNQLLGLLTALALAAMSVMGFLLWRRRRPAGELGAPTLPQEKGRPIAVSLITLILACLLPMLAISLLLLWFIDRLLPRLSPRAASWLGIQRKQAPSGP